MGRTLKRFWNIDLNVLSTFYSHNLTIVMTFLVLTTILMHNIMVESRQENDNVGCIALYNPLSKTAEESGKVDSVEKEINVESDEHLADNNFIDRMFRYKPAHKRWAAFYN